MSLETMTAILEPMLVVVCVVTTAFPLWYGLGNRFWVTRAGISIFLTSSVLALAWDLTAFLYFWPPNAGDIETYFWIEFFVFLITIATGLYLLYALWYNRRQGIMITTTTKEERDNDSSTR